jgi:4-amino-4-deoxy-L-arabinose transferase-like glycosyltransferase
MFGHSMEDGALTMCLVLAADSWERAVMEGRLRSLCWAGVWVGLGFQAKMLQAWMILPALGIGYLLAAPGGLGRRLGQLGVAGLVMLAVSLSWIALYTFTPAADRPYVDGSANNSAVAMVFGYNGVERFGVSFPGSVASFGGGGGGPVERVAEAAGGGAGQQYNAGGFLGRSGGWTKLVSDRFGPEIGWLYPLALLALIAGLAWRGRARRTDPVRAGLVMWGGWLVTFGVIYSVMSNIPHTAYMASLAPPLAALSGAGIVLFWRWYRAGSWAGWLLPVAVAAELAWAFYLWSGYRAFLPWVLPIAIGLGAVAVVVMIAGRLSRRARGAVVGAGLAVGVAAMLAAPTAWAASVLDSRYAGSSFDASAGPAGGFGPGGGGRVGGPLPRAAEAPAGRGDLRQHQPETPASSSFTGTSARTGTGPGTCSRSRPGRRLRRTSWRPGRRSCRWAGSAARCPSRRWPGSGSSWPPGSSGSSCSAGPGAARGAAAPTARQRRSSAGWNPPAPWYRPRTTEPHPAAPGRCTRAAPVVSTAARALFSQFKGTCLISAINP